MSAKTVQGCQPYHAPSNKKALAQQVREIAANPARGHEKRGELRGVFDHKCKVRAALYLLSYRMADDDTLELIMIGPHENCYRDLTNYLKARR